MKIRTEIGESVTRGESDEQILAVYERRFGETLPVKTATDTDIRWFPAGVLLTVGAAFWAATRVLKRA